MHAHAFAARHKAPDIVRRCRLAAFGQLRHERIHPDHQHAALVRRIVGARLAHHSLNAFLGLLRLGRAQHGFDIAQRVFVLAHHFKQRIGRLEAQLRGQVFQLDGRLAFTLQQFFYRLAATRDGFVCGLGIEPGAYLGLGAVADQVAQLGVEPVA